MEKTHQSFIEYLYLFISAAIIFTITAFEGPYILATILKIILWAIVPIWYVRKIRKTTIIHPSYDKHSLTLGLLAFGAVLLGYMVFGALIDAPALRTELAAQGITHVTLLGVFFYISFINSFLEEYFFRGFHVLKPTLTRIIYSSILFSLYHITIFWNYFSTLAIIISCIMLFVVGIAFCLLNKHHKSIWSSWVMHIFADLAICFIGMLII